MFPSSSIRLSLGAISLYALTTLFTGATASAQMTLDVQVPFNLTTLTPAPVSPRGIAVAADGTVYVADVQSTTTGRVIVITPTGTVGGASGAAGSLNVSNVTTIVPTVGGAPVTLQNPNAVAVDSAGHLYIADIKADKVYEVAAPETSPAATVLTYAGTGPTALATDASNDLYVADTNGDIYKFVGGTGTALNIGSTTYKPVGLAVDAAGDVIFASAADNGLYEYLNSTGVTSVFLASPSTGTFDFSAVMAGLPIGMGFDPAGNLYVLDSGTTYLWQINSATPSTNYRLVLNASTTTPGSLAVSNVGNLYLSDDSTPTAVAEVFYNGNPVNLGTIKAGVDSPLIGLNVNFYATDTNLAEYQVIEGDYTDELLAATATGTCTGAVGICNAQVFADYLASTPGLRNGYLGIIDGAGHIFAVHIIGTSQAAGLALYPGTQSALSTTSSQTLYEPQGTAVSGNGKTFFIADEGTSPDGLTYKPGVYAYTVAGGVPAGTPTPIGGFTYPLAVALDGFGNLYVADYAGSVTKFPPTYNTSNGATTWSGFGTPLTFPAGVTLTHPVDLTVDVNNNLYIGDAGSGGVNASASNPGYIVKVPGDGGLATELKYTIGGAPVIYPSGLTTDSFGNLYIADGGDGVTSTGNVDIVSAATGQASTISFGDFAPLNNPDAVAFDAAGDLYVIDSYNSRILVVPITYSGTAPTANTADIAYLGGSTTNSGLSYVSTPTSLTIWPDQNTLTVSDIGYQPGSGASYPVQVLTLLSQNASVAIPTLGNSASLKGVNVGNESITFTPPTISNSTYSLANCGTSGYALGTGIAVNPACTVTVDSSASGAGGSGTITLNASAAQDGTTLGNIITVAGPAVPPKAQISPTSSTTSQTGTITVSNIGGGTLTIGAINVSGGTTTVGTNPCSTGTTLTNVQTCSITWDIPTPSCSKEFGDCTATNTETITVISNGVSPTNSLTGTYSYSVTYFCLFGGCIPLDVRGGTAPALVPGGTAAPASRNSTSTAFTSHGFTGLTF